MSAYSVQQTMLLLAEEDAAAPGSHGRWLPWMSERGVRARLAELEAISPPSDSDKALAQLLRALAAGGLKRLWVPPPPPAAVLALKEEFPNFEPVIDSIAGQIALLRTRDAVPVPLAPVLLLGSPGIGKTTFAAKLARVLAVHHQVLPVSAMSAGFTLAGLDRGWSTGRPGEVFQAVNRSGQMNPMLIIDEIDKSNHDAKSAPLGALYQLLEAGTARAFVDEYVGEPMDASMITWVATANEADDVPSALLSRMQVFRIEAPTPGQMRPIVLAMYRELRRRLPALREGLDPAVIDRLATLEPRSAGRELQVAAGRAALRAADAGIERVAVTLADLARLPVVAPRKAIGFVG